MGLFDDLAADPAPSGAGLFADLAGPGTPPPLLARRELKPRPSKLKRAAVNAEAAFFGADGDTAGLGSEAIIDLQAGNDRKRAARGNRSLAGIFAAVGLDPVARYLNRTAGEQEAEAATKAQRFEQRQQQRRQAVADLGPAETFGEKASDLGGRLSASVAQPENFVGGPVLKGATLAGKVVRAGGAAAVANIATEPVLQASAVRRGTRERLSVKDAAINTAVAFGTGGVFGAGAHGVERLWARGTPKPGLFDDLAQPAAASDGAAPAGGIFDDLAQPSAKAAGGEVDETPPFAPNSPPPVQPSDGGIFADLRGLATESTVEQTLADMVRPDDVTPLRGPRVRAPDNRVSSLAEAERANPSTVQPIEAPNERDVFPTRRLASRSDPSRAQFRKAPMDLVTAVRRWGGLKEYGGELSHLGIDNKPRAMEFARNEHFLGKLVDNEKGLDLDDAAQRAWEEGYFPDLNERPDVETFMMALASTHRGDNRVFHPNDWEALADYRARLGDRMRIEQSGREGAPAAVIRGEPVTSDDLDARALPAEAYRSDVAPMPERAGNIRTDLLDSPQSIHRAIQTIAAASDGFEAARRGVMRQEQTKALAEELGMTVADLLKRRKGQAFNAEQVLAARQLLAKSANELVAFAKRAPSASDEELAAFRSALLRHAAIQEQVSGMTAEAGRVMAQFRMIADSRDAMRGPVIRGEVVRSFIDAGGGSEHLEDVARRLLEQGGDPPQFNKLANAAAKPGGREKFLEVYINSLLSGPQTHAVNILSNAITSIGQIPETLGAATFGAMRRGHPDRVLFSEVGARAVGLVQGAREGLRLAKTAFRTGEPSDMVGAIENSQYRAVSGRKGELIRVPTRALTAEDEFFKAIARRMELNALAVRKAAASGLKGQARRDKVAELVANPTDEMVEQSRDYARYLTYQRKLGTFGQRALAVTAAPTIKGAIAKWLFPFIRTPANLVKFAVERSPFAPLLREWQADFAAGGARRDAANARFVFGSGVAALVASWAADGTITGGGPSDSGERAMLMADGWRPYSIRIGGKFYSYERLDPLAKVLATVADMVEHSEGASERDASEVGGAVVASIIGNLTGGIFLDTFGQMSEAVDEPGRYGQRFLSSQAGKLVPAAVGQVAQATDPILREAKAPLDRIKSRIPGMSSGLLPKRDIWGQPIKRPARLGPDLASPLPVGQALNDPVNRELTRLGVKVGRLQRKIGDVELTAVEYDAYQQRAGKLSRQYVLEELRRDRKGESAADKAEGIKQAIADARADARDDMRERFPHLDADE